MRGSDTVVVKKNLLKTTCQKDLTWTVDEPTCEPIICQPEHV